MLDGVIGQFDHGPYRRHCCVHRKARRGDPGTRGSRQLAVGPEPCQTGRIPCLHAQQPQSGLSCRDGATSGGDPDRTYRWRGAFSGRSLSRWLIRISEFIALTPAIPNIWGKSGHLRYPVWYTTLEELGIELGALPPFKPMPPPGIARGLSERSADPVIAPGNWMRTRWYVDHAPQTAGGRDAWRRLDAILEQIDRIPDLPAPFDPLDWDEHGLPR